MFALINISNKCKQGNCYAYCFKADKPISCLARELLILLLGGGRAGGLLEDLLSRDWVRRTEAARRGPVA